MAKPDLLTPIVDESKFHPGFKALITSPGFAPARTLLRDVWEEYADRDGNFIEQFQTTGFDARTWELFLFAFLWDEARAEFNWNYDAPDFLVNIQGLPICIEAVTANPSQLKNVVIHSAEAKDPVLKQHHLYPIRLGSALYSKLCKRYWQLPHVVGNPIILAIQDFHEPESLYHSCASLWQYLYGIRGSWYFDENGQLHIEQITIDEHAQGEKRIPSGFFQLPNAEYVSAVLFGNTGTINKFNRLGYQHGYGREGILGMIRRGLMYDHRPNRAEPIPFAYDLGASDAPREGWSQGLSLFHNPNAFHPLPLDLMPCAYHFMEDGSLTSFSPEFHPFVSQTVVLVAHENGGMTENT